MDSRTEIREFLTSRRARITPQMVGLNVGTGLRRVPGLRRDEVAVLAGVSVEYYTRFEQGNGKGVSEAVLEGISTALRLDDAEREHLFDLVRAAGTTPKRAAKKPRATTIRPSVQRLLDGMTEVPAIIRNGRLDTVAANRLGVALYSQMYVDGDRPVNHARFVFLSPRARLLYPDWRAAAEETVAVLRAEAGRNPFDKGLSDLVGELSTRSEEFRILWAQHGVRQHLAGTKKFRHPAVGDLELTFDSLDLSNDPGLALLAYSAEPKTASADGLKLLATWMATEEFAAINTATLTR